MAIGQENAFEWIERDAGLVFNEWNMPTVDKTTFMSTLGRAYSSAATRHGDQRTSSGPFRMAIRRRSRSTRLLRWSAADHRAAQARRQSRKPEDGHPRVGILERLRSGPHVWSRCAARRPRAVVAQPEDGGRTRLRRSVGGAGGAALPQLRCANRVRTQALHRVRCLHGYLSRRLHQLHRERDQSPTCASTCVFRR